MHFRESIFYFTIFYTLCHLNTYDTATTRTIPNNRPAVITSKYSGKNGTIFISTRFGDAGDMTKQACKCINFFSCGADNYVETSNQPCDGSEVVCCKTETPLTVDWEPYTEENTATVDTSSEKNTDDESSSCQCISRSECQISSAIKKGIGKIDPKNPDQCENSEYVCCPINTPSTTSSVPRFQCGERIGVIDVRISGPKNATETNFGEFPWMASIWKTNSYADNEFICGASLLSSNILLTAAHCVHKKDPNVLKVRVGDYDIKGQIPDEKAPMQEKSISTLITHPSYDAESLFNDLAIIVTPEPFTFEDHISPVCTFLFDSKFADSQIYNSSTCFATGWGKTSADSNETSTKLKKVELEVVPFDKCQRKLRKTRLTEFFELDSSFLCAGGKKGSDTCQGDGGGPLFCPLRDYRHQYVQIGVTSWGVGCGTEVPGVYASLEANKDWLSSTYEQYKVTSDFPVSDESAFRKKT